jgi:hypothetical protein
VVVAVRIVSLWAEKRPKSSTYERMLTTHSNYVLYGSVGAGRKIVLSHVLVTIDAVWIGEWIY